MKCNNGGRKFWRKCDHYRLRLIGRGGGVAPCDRNNRSVPTIIEVQPFRNHNGGTIMGENKDIFPSPPDPFMDEEQLHPLGEKKNLLGCISCRFRELCAPCKENRGQEEDPLHMDFFRNTSLHGLKYIGQKQQHIIERLFWSFAFITGLIVAYYMISEVWGKYRNNSVIITFAPFDTKIDEIPFPAITICNMNKVLKSKAKEFMKDAKRPSSDPYAKSARENLYYLNHVCSSSKSFTRLFNYSYFRGKIDQQSLRVTNRNENNYDGGKEDLWQFFLEASPSCSEMIVRCTWQEEIQNCAELFTEIETDYGLCCTFNMAPPEVLHRYNRTTPAEESQSKWWDWDGESLLKQDKDERIKKGVAENKRRRGRGESPKIVKGPKRQKVPGKSFGLSVLLNPDLEEYFCTTSDSVGFRLVTHLPIDVPHIGDLGSAIKPNSEVFINLRPQVTIGDKDNIQDFSLKHRQCYFNEEHELGYYNYYSTSNCIDECISNLTYQECNCRRHYQPGDDSKPLCGPKQFHCASNIKKKFVENYETQCKMCIPTCTEIVYQTETTYATLQHPEILWADTTGDLAPWAHKNVSILHIYFGESSTNAKLRKELYGTVDLIANFGGLMGLCLGFSGLSLIEVIYFLTLRAWCRFRRKRGTEGRRKVEIGKTGNGGNGNWGKSSGAEFGIARSDTTTELLKHEISSNNLIYKSPELGFRRLSFKRNNNKRQQINNILYTVALAHNQDR